MAAGAQRRQLKRHSPADRHSIGRRHRAWKVSASCAIDSIVQRAAGAIMESVIRFALSNFTLTFLVVGLIFSAAGLARASKPLTTAIVVEALLFWFLFFSIGVSFFYNFVMHTFFGEMAARFIGWADSPFQAEVGYASLGFALVGLFAAFRGRDARFAAILGPAAFLWGAAAGHVREMVLHGNFAPGNAGVIFWTDILLPVIGFALLYAQAHAAGADAAARAASR
jgi:hypothetical protein